MPREMEYTIVYRDLSVRVSRTVSGCLKWRAVYIKEVDKDERIVSFRQEIYNEKGELMEVHEKYPVDSGHRKVK